jgi:hypothetical protein
MTHPGPGPTEIARYEEGRTQGDFAYNDLVRSVIVVERHVRQPSACKPPQSPKMIGAREGERTFNQGQDNPKDGQQYGEALLGSRMIGE